MSHAEYIIHSEFRPNYKPYTIMKTAYKYTSKWKQNKHLRNNLKKKHLKLILIQAYRIKYCMAINKK